jgi:hypothetical protein
MILAGLGVFLIGRWAYSLGKPQTVIDLPSPVQAVHNGRIYLTVRDSYSDNVYIRSVNSSGGSMRTLATQNISGAAITNLTATDDWVYYMLARRPGRQPSGNLPPMLGADALRAPRNSQSPVPMRLPRLCKVPTTGGPIAQVPVEIRGGAVIAGDWLYWVDQRPDKAPAVPAKEGETEIGTPQSDIVMSPIRGGPERRIPNAAIQRTRLQTNGNTVFWTVPQPGPDEKSDLFCLTDGGPAHHRIAGYTGTGAPVLLDGSIYWLQQGEDTGKEGEAPESRVISAPLDGNGTRILFRKMTDKIPTGQPKWSFTRISVHKGYLYVLAAKAFDRTSSERSHPATLFRYKPGGPEDLQKVYDFTDHVALPTFFDGDDYYYTILEERQNWFSLSDLYINRVNVLFRYHLPE